MPKDARPTRKRRLSYWVAMLLGMLGCAITANALTIALQLGGFNTWGSLPTAPSGTVKIVDADTSNVWVETEDGSLFSYELRCVGKTTCRQWVPVRAASDIEAFGVVPLKTGSQCPKGAFAPLPMEPAGKMIGCALAAFPGPEMGSVTYYALMADGTVKVWENGSSMLVQTAFFVLSTIVLPLVAAILISALYLGIRIGRKQQTEDQEFAATNTGNVPEKS